MAEIVSREKYTSGNALVLSFLNAAKLLGPLLGGFITVIGIGITSILHRPDCQEAP